jgi:pilus assembly protein Flp/PilA
MHNSWVRLARDQSGVTVIEYALIAGLISIAVVGVVTQIGNDVANLFFSQIATHL